MYQREKKLHSLTLERHEPWTPVLPPQFQTLTQQAVVVLSDTGDRALKPCLCSSQAKSEEVFHRGILDHPNLLDANMEGKWYAPHRSDHFVSFEGVPETFRPIVKDYVKFQLAAGRAAKTLAECAYYLGKFFTFFLRRYPRISNIHALTQPDIDAFMIHLKSSVNSRGNPTSNKQISCALQCV